MKTRAIQNKEYMEQFDIDSYHLSGLSAALWYLQSIRNGDTMDLYYTSNVFCNFPVTVFISLSFIFHIMIQISHQSWM